MEVIVYILPGIINVTIIIFYEAWSGERLKVSVFMEGVTPLMHSIHAQKMMDIVKVALVVVTMMTVIR